MRYRSFYIFLIFLVALGAQGETPVSASVSSTRVAVNEVFNLTIKANGSDVSEPDLSGFSSVGVQLGTASVQSSTSIQSINGKTTVMQSRTWRYPASFQQEGSVTLPRIPITVDGQECFTQPVAMEITRAVDMGSRSPGGASEITVEDLAFVRAVTDKTTLYQGEAVTLRLCLYVIDGNYVEVEGPRSLPMPDMEGFYPGPKWQNTSTEQYAGRAYRVTEFVNVLYPAMPGELKIGPWNWQGGVRWHDGRRRMQTAARMFTTNDIPITVLPLPERAEGFEGAVGKFRVEGTISQKTVAQGTPVKYILTISGEGNPNTVSAPAMPDLPWAHVSGPETETQQSENSPEITKIFTYLITPLKIGEYVIPPVSFTYFAPLIQNYKTEQTPEFPVAVAAAEGGGTFVAVGGSADEKRSRIEVVEDGIVPIITDTALLSTFPRMGSQRLSALFLVSPLPLLLLYVMLSLLLKWRSRLVQDQGYARRFYAKSMFLKTLNGARNTDDPLDALDQALKKFIADMFNINEAGLTSSDVESHLRSRGAGEELVTLTVRILRACERARYAGRASGTEEIDALYAAANEAIGQLQASFKEKIS